MKTTTPLSRAVTTFLILVLGLGSTPVYAMRQEQGVQGAGAEEIEQTLTGMEEPMSRRQWLTAFGTGVTAAWLVGLTALIVKQTDDRRHHALSPLQHFPNLRILESSVYGRSMTALVLQGLPEGAVVVVWEEPEPAFGTTRGSQGMWDLAPRRRYDWEPTRPESPEGPAPQVEEIIVVKKDGLATLASEGFVSGGTPPTRVGRVHPALSLNKSLITISKDMAAWRELQRRLPAPRREELIAPTFTPPIKQAVFRTFIDQKTLETLARDKHFMREYGLGVLVVEPIAVQPYRPGARGGLEEPATVTAPIITGIGSSTRATIPAVPRIIVSQSGPTTANTTRTESRAIGGPSLTVATTGSTTAMMMAAGLVEATIQAKIAANISKVRGTVTIPNVAGAVYARVEGLAVGIALQYLRQHDQPIASRFVVSTPQEEEIVRAYFSGATVIRVWKGPYEGSIRQAIEAAQAQLREAGVEKIEIVDRLPTAMLTTREQLAQTIQHVLDAFVVTGIDAATAAEAAGQVYRRFL